MTKWSGVTPNNSPALADYLMGVTSGNVDYRVTIQNLVNLILTTKLLTIPYKFSVYRSSNQLIGAGATAKVQFDTKLYDTGSNFDNVTNFRFTAPVAGFYRFTASVFLFTSGSFVYNIQLYKNGSSYATLEQTKTSAANSQTNGEYTMQLAANDYVEVFVLNLDSGGDNIGNGQGGTYFQGELIGVS